MTSPMTSPLLELADRCEKAEGPDRALEVDVHCMMVYGAVTADVCRGATWQREPIPAYTSSIDAAMSLSNGLDAHDLLVEAAGDAWNRNCAFGRSAAETSLIFLKALPRYVTAASLRAAAQRGEG